MKAIAVIVGIVVLFFVFATKLVFGQAAVVNGPPPASVKTTPAAKAADPIPLTSDEGKDLEINQLKAQNMALQIDKLQLQIQKAQNEMNQETEQLQAKLVKAHDIDLKKYRLDAQSKSFVPIPQLNVPEKPKPPKK